MAGTSLSLGAVVHGVVAVVVKTRRILSTLVWKLYFCRCCRLWGEVGLVDVEVVARECAPVPVRGSAAAGLHVPGPQRGALRGGRRRLKAQKRAHFRGMFLLIETIIRLDHACWVPERRGLLNDTHAS